MSRHDKTGEIPSAVNGEWQGIEQALRVAREMARLTRDGLSSIIQQQIKAHVLTQPDPRIAKSLTLQKSKIITLLSTHFKISLPDPIEVDNLRIAYHNVFQRLTGLSRSSFRMLTHKVINSESVPGQDTFGLVFPDKPFIYLNETYFSYTQNLQKSHIPQAVNSRNLTENLQKGQVRGIASGDEAGLRLNKSPEERGSIILHEAVHLCYGFAGIIHRTLSRGQEIKINTMDCDKGFPQISNYNSAKGDAYVYERFALCVFRLSGNKRNK